LSFVEAGIADDRRSSEKPFQPLLLVVECNRDEGYGEFPSFQLSEKLEDDRHAGGIVTGLRACPGLGHVVRASRM